MGVSSTVGRLSHLRPFLYADQMLPLGWPSIPHPSSDHVKSVGWVMDVATTSVQSSVIGFALEHYGRRALFPL